MLAGGHYQEAADFVVKLSEQENYGPKRWTDPFFPACDLLIATDPQGDVRDYARSLDFETGVATVAWTDNRGSSDRRLFVSRPDNVVVLSLRGKLDCTLELAQHPAGQRDYWDGPGKIARGIKEYSSTADSRWLLYTSHYQLTDGGYACLAKVLTSSGETRVQERRLRVRNAKELAVLLRIFSMKHFRDFDLERAKEELSSAGSSFDALLVRHAAEHRRIFNRATLDLAGGDDRSVPSEELVA